MDIIKISIVTVSYNAVKTIEQTIQSVVNQTYDNIEYIIIDGGSTDGTVDIIKKYKDKIAYWVSEPDHGIYDAMNKGIDIATGDYIYFIGSDDCLVNEHVIHDVCNKLHLTNDIYCGNVILYNDKYKMIKKWYTSRNLEDIKYGKMCPHQGIFVRLDLMKNKFDIHYKIAADFDFLLKCVIENRIIEFIDNDIAYYNVNGTSSDRKLYEEYSAIIKKYLDDSYLLNINKLKNNNKNIIWIIKRVTKVILREKTCLMLNGWKKLKNR